MTIFNQALTTARTKGFDAACEFATTDETLDSSVGKEQGINLNASGGTDNWAGEREVISFSCVYEFLKRHYKHERFEGRNGAWCRDYSSVVARSAVDDLEKYGESLISMNESTSGVAIRFNSALKPIGD